MHGDAFFAQGKGHTVCEDYACSTVVHGIPLIIVSDGCSSSPNTDVGARLLVHSIARLIYKTAFPFSKEDAEQYCWAAAQQASSLSEQLCLSSRAIDATLLMAYVANDNVYILTTGDGLVHIQRTDPANNQLYRFHFPSGAPHYLSYELDPVRKQKYLQEFGGERLVEDLLPAVKQEAVSPIHFECIPRSDIVSISLMTDGCESFEHCTALEVAKNLTAFKNYAGAFVERRVRKGLRDYFNEEINHIDDVSVASLYLGPE